MSNNILSSTLSINPSLVLNDGFELNDQNIISSQNFNGKFSPSEDNIELFIYDYNKNLLESNYKFTNYSIQNDSSISISSSVDSIQLNPQDDIVEIGYNVGNFYNIYNFVHYELKSNPTSRYYIKEISSDRTEIKICSNFISNDDVVSSFNEFKSKISNQDYFDEFYICFDGNNGFIGINTQLDLNKEQASILIKLYKPLPTNFVLKDELYVTTKVAETQAYEIKFISNDLFVVNKKFISGPNININVKDSINNSTELKTYQDLLDSNVTGSRNQLSNLLNQKGIKITPNYSYDTFDEFVNFSSAKKRIENFLEKVSQIQTYSSSIASLNNITGSTSTSIQVSSSINILENKITDIVKNFDGYDYYLYYESGSSSYPKTNSSKPYTLYSTASSTVNTWLGSDVEGSQYYGGIRLSASFYDNTNPNYLYYAIPEFIRSNSDNNQYVEFINMIGQHFDELWLYIKSITERSNSTNELDKGIPLKLVNEAIKSLGFDEISNNYNNWDNYSGLTGLNPQGGYMLPTGSELVTEYIAVNSGNVSSSWNPDYEFLDAFPYATDDISKEIYKRLYHNMSYLVKKKGTISGLRQLINIWGIPNTILRINEFGGKNKDNTNDYDLWNNRYSYAFKNVQSASILVPWQPLKRNFQDSNQYIVPDSIQFRFKTTGYPSSSAGTRFSQSLLLKKSDSDNSSTNFDFGIILYYTGSQESGSYSGSITNEYKDYGNLRFYMSASAADGGVKTSGDIFLPFFDKGWWTIMLQRDTHHSASNHEEATTYTLYAKNNVYNGYDGNGIGFQGTASITSITGSSVYGSASYGTGSYGPLQSVNRAWNSYGTSSVDGIYLGGFISGSVVAGQILSPSNKLFSGSFQEFRYYSSPLSESIFNDFVMNPESIEGINITGSKSSFDILSFRAPLGNELETKFTTTSSAFTSQSFTSLHPSITGSSNSLITSSFINPSQSISSSTYTVFFHSSSFTGSYSEPVTQIVYLDQPAAGIRNRINNKIQVVESASYGTILSSQRSIQQNYPINEDYTENINSLEVAFSPQESINDDIIQSIGFGVITDTLGDPRQISSSDDFYPSLRKTAEDYFKKYEKSNIYDYIRLIKYFDNSLFKAIKNYIPARTSLSTGIVIKQHLLERNKIRPIQISTLSLSSSNAQLSCSIAIGEFSGGTGGSLNQFHYSGSASFGQINNTQSWNNTFDTPVGLQTIVEDTQIEFFNGEFSGSNVTSTTQSLNPGNIYKASDYVGSTASFEHGEFNAIHNNVSGSRNNSFLRDLDYGYDYKTPVNISLVRSGSASFSQVPDSNYTSKRIINPRYDGCRLYSLTYNKYTGAGTVGPEETMVAGLNRGNKAAYFLNGDTGSWEGDTSYGRNSIIDINPTYFAHFKSSNENYNVWGTYTYTLDQLILIPDEDIRSIDGYNPITIPLENNKNNLLDVSSVFTRGRKTNATYDSLLRNGIDYTKLKVGGFEIFQGGLDFQTLNTNEKDQLNYAPSYSYDRFKLNYSGSNGSSTIVQMGTGSGYLLLSGSVSTATFYKGLVEGNPSGSGQCEINGPQLAVYHMYNQYLYKRQIFTTAASAPYKRIWVDAKIDPTLPESYYIFNTEKSQVNGYENPSEPFLLLPGDEIRVSYKAYSGTPIANKSEFKQDFTVMGVGSRVDVLGTLANQWSVTSNGVTSATSSVDLLPSYDLIYVTPNPATLTVPIPKGEIYSFTIRRRTETSNKIIVNTIAPSGSLGSRTRSGGGFLIPDDLTKTQKDNVLNIITQLKGKNSFRNDDSTT